MAGEVCEDFEVQAGGCEKEGDAWYKSSECAGMIRIAGVAYMGLI